MGRQLDLSLEAKNSIVWLERQPGVTSVVKGRRTRTMHKHPLGYATVMRTDAKVVDVRIYDAGKVLPLTVHAKASPERDRWVAQLAGGCVIDELANRPRLVKVAPKADAQTPAIERPPAVKDNAAQVYMVGPDLAAQWLELNKRNRDTRDSIVAKYAADMLAGRWKLVGDAVQFDTGSNIINGQHRLWAVVESGCTVPLLVMFDCDPESIDVMDDHLKRSLRDVAKIRRPTSSVSTFHTAVANMLIRSSIAATLVDRKAANERVSRQAQLEALDRHWEAIEFVYHEVLKGRKIRGLTVTAVVTPMVRAYYTEDHERLRQFGKALINGQMENEGDRAVILLRNWLLQQQAGNLRAVTETTYKKAERALRAFLDSAAIAILYEAAEELFPLPEEQASSGRKKAR